MNFQIQKDWEIHGPLDSLFDGPEMTRFPLVQLSLNFKVYLVDATIEDDQGAAFVERFMFGDLGYTLRFIEQDGFKDTRISLLSRRCDNGGDYSVSDVSEIIRAKGEGEQVHIICCKDGKRYIDSMLDSSEEDLTDHETIYFKSLTSVDI